MKKLLLTLLLASSIVSYSQSWTEQATSYPVASMYTGDISVVDSNVAWAMAQRTSTTNYQRYSKTIDGGTTWTTGAIGVGNSTGLGIGNITAADANTAWVSVFPTNTALGTQGVYKTINGGTTWTKQASAAFTSASFIDFVYFWDASNGVCVGDQKNGIWEIYTTANGGSTWTATPSANIPSTVGVYGYTGKYFVQGNTIWFGDDAGELLKSTDKGLHWTLITTPITDFGGGTDTTSVAEFAFLDENTGIIVKENYDGLTPTSSFIDFTSFTTADGGLNWVEVTPAAGMFHGSIGYAGDKLISAGSSTGNFGSSYTTDNGLTWTAIDGLSHTCLSFKNGSTTGWGGGFNTSATVGGIFKYSPSLSNNSFLNSTFKTYPNPASNYVNIYSNEIKSSNLKVTDILGKIILEKSINGMENRVDVSSLTPGMYFFTFTSDNKSETTKIIKN